MQGCTARKSNMIVGIPVVAVLHVLPVPDGLLPLVHVLPPLFAVPSRAFFAVPSRAFFAVPSRGAAQSNEGEGWDMLLECCLLAFNLELEWGEVCDQGCLTLNPKP
jgi:hypothetical protein